MSDPVVGVLALQGDVREHLVALAALDVVARPVRRESELDSVDGLVIPGGESTTISRLAAVFELHEPITRRIAGGMPAYGSCAGMIMLAESILDGRPDQKPFGGIDMVVRRNAFGRQVDSFETDLAFADLDETVHAVFIRAPWVEKVGTEATVLARLAAPEASGTNDGGDGTIVAVRQGNVLATSFHPELTGDTRVHAYFVDMVRAAT